MRLSALLQNAKSAKLANGDAQKVCGPGHQPIARTVHYQSACLQQLLLRLISPLPHILEHCDLIVGSCAVLCPAPDRLLWMSVLHHMLQGQAPWLLVVVAGRQEAQGGCRSAGT